MTTIQETIYNLEQGRGVSWVRWIVFLVAFFVLAGWLNLFQFRGFASQEAMDDAQLARQLAQGHGFTTYFVRPAALAQMRDRAYLRQGGLITSPATASSRAVDLTRLPDTANPPLYPLCLAALFKVSGVSFSVPPEKLSNFHFFTPELAVNLFNQFCLALTAVAVFLLGRSLFDQRVGLLAAAACLAGDLNWRFSLSGLPVCLTLLLITLAALFLHRALLREEEGRSWPWLSLALGAFFLGLAVLSQYTAGWLLPPFLAAALLGLRARWRTAALLLAVWGVLLTPWALREIALTGNPVGVNTLLLGTGGESYPGTSLERSYRFKTGVLIWQEGLHKAAHGLRYHIENFYRLLGTGIAPAFFLVGLLYLFRRRRGQIVRGFVLVGLLCLAFGTSLVKAEPEPATLANTLFLLWPLVTLLGASFFFILLDRLQVSGVLRPWVIGLFLAVNSLPLLATLAGSGRGAFAYPPYFPPILLYSAPWFEPNEAIASDMPWAVAWYQNRPSLWLPATRKDFMEIHDYVSSIRGVLFTPVSRNAANLFDIERGEWAEWESLINKKGYPPDFPLQTALPLPPNGSDYLLFADHVRWPVAEKSP
ncbi:MAG: glycosyltransferase family 39 protein [Verrucomicrobium sp.]|nr:glycosyltransferase family 39 protein [Verrucomicrobium sp.]